MRIGLFGGSFNPIHEGHIALANNFVTDLKLQKLILMPANIPPHKSAVGLASGEHRLNMCRLAAKRIHNAEASDLELNRDEVSYTVDTLEELHCQYGEKIFLIMGTDMFLTVDTWRNSKRIFELATVCASARDENEFEKLTEKAEFLKDNFNAESVVKAFPVIKLSSTEIRNRLKRAQSCSGLIDSEVLEYIAQNRIY